MSSKAVSQGAFDKVEDKVEEKVEDKVSKADLTAKDGDTLVLGGSFARD